MKKYPRNENSKNIHFTKFRIVVPTIADKMELEKAFRHIHDADIDTQYVAVNQLAHMYMNDQIVVDEDLYDEASKQFPVC